MKTNLLFFLLFVTSLVYGQSLKTPQEFLGYELGDRFTRHHRVVEYFQHVAHARPDNVKFIQYGETNEYRPLIITVIGSTENIKNLEQIRLDNLKRAGLEQGTPASKIAIVWLSYNVHGNEANSMEAAMKTIYDLADPSNSESQNWLKNTIVIIDPCINPDGRDRYANFYNQYGNSPATSNGDSKEHHEPWPGGRANHYLFDLNRDWAWQTQKESKARIELYNQWMPHVHVDFHEQSYRNPYYFAPAAEPLHEVITKWQREFETMIGRNNAKHFDKEGWLYFTKESFDLFYPSYGDSYPMFNGAIGMTYEQAGGGYGGLTIMTPEGDPLTLKDRLTHHYTTGMSTVEITAQNADRVVEEFGKYFSEGMNNPSSSYKTYVIKGDNNPDKVHTLTAWLDSHKIQYGHPSGSRTTKGFDFQTRQTGNVSISTNDLIINVYQPKGRFITTLFEPQSKLNDSITYDITAWNLMYGYNLKGYALNDRINIGAAYTYSAPDNTSISGKPYAYLFRYESLEDVKFLGAMIQKGINVRSAERPFAIGGNNFDRGTLLVTRRNNETVTDFDKTLREMANAHGRKIYTTTTGFADRGKDIGSGEVNYLVPPKIAILGGEGSSSLSFGEIWYFFEQQLHYPVTVLDTEYFKSIDLSKYNVLVIPNGRYRFDEATQEMIETWVTSGGKLIAVSGALSAFADQKGFALKRYATEEAKKAAQRKDEEEEKANKLVPYEDVERVSISSSIEGAIYKVKMDASHPLAFGLGADYYSLRTSSTHFDYMSDAWNVGTLRGSVKPVMGFAGFKANKDLENSMVFGVEDKGRGHIVYLVDNPLFRCFWENGKLLFANAVFMVQ